MKHIVIKAIFVAKQTVVSYDWNHRYCLKDSWKFFFFTKNDETYLIFTNNNQYFLTYFI